MTNLNKYEQLYFSTLKRHQENIEVKKSKVEENQKLRKQQAEMLASFRRIERWTEEGYFDKVILECMKHLPKRAID